MTGFDWIEFPRHISLSHSKNKIEVAKRVLCMYALSSIVEGTDVSHIKKWILQNKLYNSLSESEKKILNKHKDYLSDREMLSLIRLKEGVWMGLWVLEFLEKFTHHTPAKIERVLEYTPIIPQNQAGQTFLSRAKILPTLEIFRMYYFYLSLHLISLKLGEVNNSMEDIPFQDGTLIQGSIIYERLMILSWVLYPPCGDWDNINFKSILN